MKLPVVSHVFLPVIVLAAAVDARAELVLDDDLQGATTGTRIGGTFVAGGWRVDNQYDAIYWHIPTVTEGAAEFDVTGLGPGCPGGAGTANELFMMYDYTFNNADVNYNPGFRDNPYKHYFLKRCGGGNQGRLKVVWKIDDEVLEENTQVFAWDAAQTYRFRFEWGPDGGGNAVLRSYRNGALYHTQTVPESWTPAGHTVRIASSTRRADEGASVGVIYSNLKVWDTSIEAPIIDPVTPATESAFIGTPYTKQLTLTAGLLPITWSVDLGPPGLGVSATGFVSGWTPGHADAGTATAITIRATNSEGLDTAAWQVDAVYRADFDLDLDVDQADFGVFHACLSGSGFLYPEGCAAADLDADNDVDADDFGIFQACMGGPNIQPDPDCAM
jgi:hypothetical protein